MESNISDPRNLLPGNTNYFRNNVNDYDVAEYNLNSDVSELRINTSGAAHILPSGVKIVIPKGIACNKDKINCTISKKPNKFKLNPTDQLLSSVVELTPHSATFSKSLRMSIPYHYNRCDKQNREIVMRVTYVPTNGLLKYEDLNSEMINTVKENAKCFSGEVVSFVSNLSTFGVICRLKEDHVVVENEQHINILSSVEPLTWLHFPQSSVINQTEVTITMLAINEADVKDIAKSDHCPVSNVLQVCVSPKNTVFQTPVTVHLALPKSLACKPYDKDMLRLLTSSNESEDWRDITPEVKLRHTTVDISFQVDSFSKFWFVWKTLKIGVLKKVFRQTITYDVQFLVMQRKEQPSQVLAECIRADLAERRIKELIEEGYCKKSLFPVVQNFMEGEQFKVEVIGGIQVKSNNKEEKKYLEENVLRKNFLSQYPPGKGQHSEFFIEPLDPASKTNTGYILLCKEINNGNTSAKKIHLKSACTSPMYQ